ncbi:conserved hypothetical protein [Candidatus Nitrotoga sp. HW29]|uniref:hypothetical protein n=1 Tax=Candidatus Nitrotoga sp. HW29 TaxID=2886963 RepID=UPI001EF204D9|nr:hypothetical protein [Candidatus Nitrotoga sp. HW29]CAH1903681.1 conserved hypothetical protein [Candidatus Nitrotoga sp. HW29]
MPGASYRFRLRLACKRTGTFAFSTPTASVPVSDGLTFELSARNADSLDEATNFHFDGGGFLSANEARQAAEALRIRLRLLNAILGLGLNIPVGDKVSSQVSEEIKTKLKSEQNATVIDSIWGVSVYPDDGLHFEYILSGNVVVKPSDPSYILDGLKTIWDLVVSLDSASEVALHILCLATQETSDKANFLTSYLALEQLVDRESRSTAAQAAIRRFQDELTSAATIEKSLTDAEVRSLNGALASLNEESFPSALTRLGTRIATPARICGVTPTKFLSACISARNKIAHHAEPETEIPLGELAKGLREFVLGLIWTRNSLPSFTMTTPPSAVSIPSGGMSIRVM